MLLLTLLQGDLCQYVKVSTFRFTVGHVEVEVFRDGDLVAFRLDLAEEVLLRHANSPHQDIGVAVPALGLAPVEKHQVCIHF